MSPLRCIDEKDFEEPKQIGDVHSNPIRDYSEMLQNSLKKMIGTNEYIDGQHNLFAASNGASKGCDVLLKLNQGTRPVRAKRSKKKEKSVKKRILLNLYHEIQESERKEFNSPVPTK